ncbi:MAG: addiction module protein [Candidatus Acidiferrum sp.]
MTQRSLELLEKALALTEEERAELAASLLQSLDQSTDEDAEAAWQRELERRADDLNSGKAKTIPWDEVRGQISTRLRHGPEGS